MKNALLMLALVASVVVVAEVSGDDKLLAAISNGDLAAVKQLLKDGVNADGAPDPIANPTPPLKAMTFEPLFQAATRGETEILQALLDGHGSLGAERWTQFAGLPSNAPETAEWYESNFVRVIHVASQNRRVVSVAGGPYWDIIGTLGEELADVAAAIERGDVFSVTARSYDQRNRAHTIYDFAAAQLAANERELAQFEQSGYFSEVRLEDAGVVRQIGKAKADVRPADYQAFLQKESAAIRKTLAFLKERGAPSGPTSEATDEKIRNSPHVRLQFKDGKVTKESH